MSNETRKIYGLNTLNKTMTKEEILKKCRVEGTIVKLPEDKLDRKMYLEVAKSLELIGGKWKGGKIFGFVFQTDPTELLEEIASGEARNLKKEFQFFATPNEIADRLVELAEINDNDIVLEPSAGQGAIIRAIRRVSQKCTIEAVELMPVNHSILQKLAMTPDYPYTKQGFNWDFTLHLGDFLNYTPTYAFGGMKTFTKIIANPPFTKNQDIDHIRQMYSHLKVGGRLVTVASRSWVNGGQKKQFAFREWLEEVWADVEEIEPGRFKESGTSVGGVIITINKDDSQEGNHPKGTPKNLKIKEAPKPEPKPLPHPAVILDELIAMCEDRIESYKKMKADLPTYKKEAIQEEVL